MKRRGAALALLLLGSPAVAAPPPSPDGGACRSEALRIAELDGALATCREDRRTLEVRVARGESELVQRTGRLTECTATAQACQTARTNLCSAADDLARAVLEATALPMGATACVSGDHQSQLGRVAAGWARLGPELDAVAGYVAGETDVQPRDLGLGATPQERALARVIGAGRARGSLIYRRLLVEAVRRIAPRYWRRLHASGGAVMDAWFGGGGRLDDALVHEVRHDVDVRAAPSGAAGPPLVAALKYVQAYYDIVGCASLPGGAHDCARARSLQELLEASGPLVVRRREQQLWAMECSALTPAAVLDWFQEFPSPQAPIRRADWDEIVDAAFSKLYTCFLADPAAGASYRRWMERRVPGASEVTGRAFALVDALRGRFVDGGQLDLCARALRALDTMPPATTCALPPSVEEALGEWLPIQARLGSDDQSFPLRACVELVHLRWEGEAGHVPASFGEPPSAADLVRPVSGPSPMARLRALCRDRSGARAEFPDELRRIAALAQAVREPLDRDPWRADPRTLAPLEEARFSRSTSLRAYASDVIARRPPCDTLGLSPARCAACNEAGASGHYDCALLGELEAAHADWRRRVATVAASALCALLAIIWVIRLLRGFRRFGAWLRATRGALGHLALRPRRDPWRWLVPSRMQVVTAELPRGAAWERWGTRAVLVRTRDGRLLRERDVNQTADAARRAHTELALLIHDEGASPDLAAVRAMLDQTARGRRAVQVLPVAMNRLLWARTSDDLLDLVEQTSLRGNPFDVRGRITSSAQFFDRELYVSGLLAAAQAGQWTIVTGLRRFGKSSLALEVARRLPGPSAYVDLAGFHHEIAMPGEPARAAETILLYLCVRLREAAAERWPDVPLPDAPEAASLDGGGLASWLRAFGVACAQERPGGQMLIIFDELEQAIGVGPERLSHALDVLAILVGRLRAALDEPLRPRGAPRVGVLLCGALHPLMWAPLATLGNQSLVGAFPSVCVSTLGEDAAVAMMRGLGARQGIRFSDAALRTIIDESQGVPLLARRLGSSVLELYDPERARQGGLGAVDVGAEGAAAAVARESEDGAPLRVWVESEIGDPTSPSGALLRALARVDRAPAAQLRAIAREVVEAQFEVQGIRRVLGERESAQRAEAAAAYLVRMVASTGLLVAEGDVARPDSYRFPDGLVRRILAARSGGGSPLDG